MWRTAMKSENDVQSKEAWQQVISVQHFSDKLLSDGARLLSGFSQQHYGREGFFRYDPQCCPSGNWKNLRLLLPNLSEIGKIDEHIHFR